MFVVSFHKKEIREKFGSSWDKLDAEQRNKIAEQINKAWKSSTLPLNKIIEKAKIDSLRLADAKGMKLTLGTMADALVNAKPIKVKNDSIFITRTKSTFL